MTSDFSDSTLTLVGDDSETNTRQGEKSSRKTYSSQEGDDVGHASLSEPSTLSAEEESVRKIVTELLPELRSARRRRSSLRAKLRRIFRWVSTLVLFLCFKLHVGQFLFCSTRFGGPLGKKPLEIHPLLLGWHFFAFV